MAPRGLERLTSASAGRLGEGAEDAAAVEPAGAFVSEDRVPVDLSRAQLGDGGMAAVGAADGTADAEATLGEVQPVAAARPTPSYGDPDHMRLVDAALVDEVLDQTADRVVGERGDDRRVEPEAAAQPACDVVLAAALPDVEAAGRGDSTVSRVEPEHHLAERHEVPAALAAAGSRAPSSRRGDDRGRLLRQAR